MDRSIACSNPDPRFSCPCTLDRILEAGSGSLEQVAVALQLLAVEIGG